MTNAKKTPNAYERRMAAVREQWSPETKALSVTLNESFDLAARLFELRHDAGLTQQELAELTGVPQSEISKIEKGRVSPSATRMGKLFAGVGAPLRAMPMAAMARVQPAKSAARMAMKAGKAVTLKSGHSAKSVTPAKPGQPAKSKNASRTSEKQSF